MDSMDLKEPTEGSSAANDPDDELLVVFVTFPSLEKARQIGTHLVERQLIACINCLPQVTSIYQWEGKICEDEECLGIMKTKRSVWSKLKQAICEQHPYDTPEVLALLPEEVSAPYREWVFESTAAG